MQKKEKPMQLFDKLECTGHIKMFSYDPVTKQIDRIVEKHNLILYSGADVMARVLAGQNYAVSTMYVEFKNLAVPGTVTPPTFGREPAHGLAYYDSLSGSVDVDFLRIPIVISPSLTSSDVASFDNNQVNFFAITEGTQGFHGKDFSAASNSAVYGAALVSSPVWSDQTQDIVFARGYPGTIAKQASSQIGTQWITQFN